MIQLTREEAEMVLGPSPSDPTHALEPVPLKDDSYVLPEDVAVEPANADVAEFLTTKIVPGGPDPALVWDFTNPDDVAAYDAAKLTWSEGGVVRAAAAARKERE